MATHRAVWARCEVKWHRDGALDGGALAEWGRGWVHCCEAEERWGLVSKNKNASVRGTHSLEMQQHPHAGGSEAGSTSSLSILCCVSSGVNMPAVGGVVAEVRTGQNTKKKLWHSLREGKGVGVQVGLPTSSRGVPPWRLHFVHIDAHCWTWRRRKGPGQGWRRGGGAVEVSKKTERKRVKTHSLMLPRNVDGCGVHPSLSWGRA